MTVATAGVLEVVNPATLDVVGSVAADDPSSAPARVSAAAAAQSSWAERTPRERAGALRALLRIVLARADEIADTVIAETAKPRVEAFTTELFPAADALAWLARSAPRLLAPDRVRFTQPHLLHKRGRTVYEPLGVVAVIAPWNFPFAIPFTQAAFAVAAGNAVVLKPSELTPLSGALVASLFAEVGAPVTVLQGGGDVGAALVEAPGVAKVVFTGSGEVGRKVAAAAGARLLPVTLELGGKDPMLVLDDADLPRAVSGALWASFMNCGQVCSGVERIYVEGALYEPFVEELVRRTHEAQIGPLISEEQRARVEGLVADAVARGARTLTGGTAPDRTGWFFEPTVLADVPADARIQHEETFGPVVTVQRVADERAAVAAANERAYGLGASVWTRDAARAARLAGKLRAGTVWHNDHAYSYATAQASWGGLGASGFGRTHSSHGLYDLTAVKFVDRDGGRLGVPWWFPYDDGSSFRGVLRAMYGRAYWRERRALFSLMRRYRL
ncbi:MAG TPA: aldehyde dehydrogenase family protein [Gaiellaceae bacterium]|nr:aldehyde dehydrogenase family protein [Gaiellaceae bacterium]